MSIYLHLCTPFCTYIFHSSVFVSLPIPMSLYQSSLQCVCIITYSDVTIPVFTPMCLYHYLFQCHYTSLHSSVFVSLPIPMSLYQSSLQCVCIIAHSDVSPFFILVRTHFYIWTTINAHNGCVAHCELLHQSPNSYTHPSLSKLLVGKGTCSQPAWAG